MTSRPDLLAEVVQELNSRQGDLAAVARGAGIPYDTVLRIKRQENDPGYSKVATLHRYLFPPSANEAGGAIWPGDQKHPDAPAIPQPDQKAAA